ncbi:MAG: hypothetical protein KDA96_10610, partial [Planctomycetaceae bacterium]|nr:hypothetical protein [Planctomycetaceae bacterium]
MFRDPVTRRHWLTTAGLAAMASAAPNAAAQLAQEGVSADSAVTRRRIHQSVMGWCFKPMPVPELIRHCAEMGLEAIEGIDPQFYPEARRQGLK